MLCVFLHVWESKLLKLIYLDFLSKKKKGEGGRKLWNLRLGFLGSKSSVYFINLQELEPWQFLWSPCLEQLEEVDPQLSVIWWVNTGPGARNNFLAIACLSHILP